MKTHTTIVLTNTDAAALQSKINMELDSKLDNREIQDVKYSSAFNGGNITYSALLLFKLPGQKSH